MEYRHYTGNQTTRSENAFNSQSFYNSTNGTRQLFTNYPPPQQQASQPIRSNNSQQSQRRGEQSKIN